MGSLIGNLIDIDDIDVTYIDVTYMNDMNVLYNGFYIDRKGLKVPYLICKILQLLKVTKHEFVSLLEKPVITLCYHIEVASGTKSLKGKFGNTKR